MFLFLVVSSKVTPIIVPFTGFETDFTVNNITKYGVIYIGSFSL